MFGRKYWREIDKRLSEIEEVLNPAEARTPNMLERIATERSPDFSVQRISNGYLVVVHQPARMHTSITYCKDAKELADHIIAGHARKRLDVPEQEQPEQLDLFGGSTVSNNAFANGIVKGLTSNLTIGKTPIVDAYITTGTKDPF